MHGTSSLTNRTQPSFLTSNPLQTTTQQKHEQFPLLVARVHKPSPRGGPLCATAAGRGKRASALTGRAASRSASFHPSGKWSSTPTAGEAERVLAQGPRPLQCACKRACRAADLCFFLCSNTHYRACAAPGHLARRCLASALASPGPRLFGAPRRCAPAPLACARSFLPPGGERRKSIFAARGRAWSGLAPLLAPAFCPARTSGPPPNLRLSLRTRACGALARPAARERKRCGARKGRAACFLGGLSPFRG